MMPGRWWILLLLLLAVPSSAKALEAQMRVALAGEEPYWVGQRIGVTVDLLSTGFSFSQQRFDLPQLPGVVLLPPSSAGQTLTETIDGETWQGLRYRLSLLVLGPGELQIPPFTVSFMVAAGFGSEPESFSLDSEPLQVVVQQPPGTDKLGGLLTTPELQVESQWQPEPTDLKVGDALTLTLRRVAVDIPGAAIPPLELQIPAGLEAYPEPPEINDRTDRGDLIGERTERISVVMQTPGDYQLPGVTLPWFDPSSETLHQEEIPALSFSVAPDPNAPAPPTEDPVPDRRSGWWIFAVAVAAVLALAIWWLLPRGRALWRDVQTRRRNSEAGRFRALLATCRNGDPRATDRALLAWMAALDGAPVSPTALAARHPELVAPVADLQAALSGASAHWSEHGLADALQHYRRQRERVQRHREPLPPLNPSTGSSG